MKSVPCTAFGANLIYNVSMALVMTPVLGGIHIVSFKQALVYAVIFGTDLGLNLTTVGSLTTMLWLLILRRKGLEISTRGYFKLGISVVPVMIVAVAVDLAKNVKEDGYDRLRHWAKRRT